MQLEFIITNFIISCTTEIPTQIFEAPGQTKQTWTSTIEHHGNIVYTIIDTPKIYATRGET